MSPSNRLPRTTNICQTVGDISSYRVSLKRFTGVTRREIRRCRTKRETSLRERGGGRKIFTPTASPPPAVCSWLTRCGMCVSWCPLATQPPALVSRLLSHVVVFIGLMLQIFFFSLPHPLRCSRLFTRVLTTSIKVSKFPTLEKKKKRRRLQQE